MARACALLALPAVGLALTGCTQTEIDAGEAEAFVADNVGAPRPERVECPEDVEANKGETFECQIVYPGGERATVTLHIRDDEGRISFRSTDVRPAR